MKEHQSQPDQDGSKPVLFGDSDTSHQDYSRKEKEGLDSCRSSSLKSGRKKITQNIHTNIVKEKVELWEEERRGNDQNISTSLQAGSREGKRRRSILEEASPTVSPTVRQSQGRRSSYLHGSWPGAYFGRPEFDLGLAGAATPSPSSGCAEASSSPTLPGGSSGSTRGEAGGTGGSSTSQGANGTLYDSKGRWDCAASCSEEMGLVLLQPGGTKMTAELGTADRASETFCNLGDRLGLVESYDITPSIIPGDYKPSKQSHASPAQSRTLEKVE